MGFRYCAQVGFWAMTMTPHSDWWSQVRTARNGHAEAHTLQQAWRLRKGGHAAVLAVRAVPQVGTDVTLPVDGELVKSRLFRAHQQEELASAIAGTRAQFEAKGWE
jgi:hypothetical protein